MLIEFYMWTKLSIRHIKKCNRLFSISALFFCPTVRNLVSIAKYVFKEQNGYRLDNCHEYFSSKCLAFFFAVICTE